MKFNVNNLTKCVPRLGIINDIRRLPDFQVETPAAFMYTKGGSIPHITHEVLKFITEEPQCLQISIANSLSLQESLKDSNFTLAEFIGLPDYFIYATVQDPGDITPSGHHLQNNIPIWTRAGKVYINPENYMNTIQSYKPDMYCIISDSDTNACSSKKRIAKAVDQTLAFVEKCLDIHENSEVLKNSAIIASIEGGYCLKSRERYIQDILKEKDKFAGFLINGLHNNGPEMELLPFQDMNEIVDFIINHLPEDKLRIVEGCWNPVNVIKFVNKGVDIFDTSYTHLVTERQGAITFDFNIDSMLQIRDIDFEINLRDTIYAEDFRPLCHGCTCLSCTKYSRSYIHHLINVQELLGPVLLSIHNIHYYKEFFKRIRQCIKQGNLEQLENYISTQFENHQSKSANGISTQNNEVQAEL